MPFVGTSIVSPGSTTLPIAASIAAEPVPETGIVQLIVRSKGF